MLEKINWNGSIAWAKTYFYTIISIIVLLGFLLLFPALTQWSQNPITILWFDLSIDRFLGYISILIGLASVSLALLSMQSTIISLKDIQSDYWNVRGLDQKKQENYFDAFQAFDKSVRINSVSIKSLINKANALIEKGRKYQDKTSLIEAIRVIEQAIGRGRVPPLTWKNGTPGEFKAKQEYANALKTECDALIALVEFSKGFTYKEELLAQALKASEKAIKEYSFFTFDYSSELPGAFASKATALSFMGRHDEALEACDEAIKQASYEGIIWAIKGNVFNNKGIFLKRMGDGFYANGFFLEAKEEYSQAVKEYSSSSVAYDRAIELKPNHADYWHNKGTVLLNKAMVLLKTIDSPSKILMGEDEEAYNEALNCFNAAIHAFDKAIEFDSLQFETWKSKGDAFREQGLNKEAIDAYNMAIDINPLNLTVQNGKQGAINAQINEISAGNEKGIELLSHSMYGDAVRSFDKVIKKDPSLKSAFCNMGFALHKIGKYDEALEAYYNAIELDPNYALAWNGKGHSLKALGRIRESNAAFAEATRLGGGV